jgi:hypothetical protein
MTRNDERSGFAFPGYLDAIPPEVVSQLDEVAERVETLAATVESLKTCESANCIMISRGERSRDPGLDEYEDLRKAIKKQVQLRPGGFVTLRSYEWPVRSVKLKRAWEQVLEDLVVFTTYESNGQRWPRVVADADTDLLIRSAHRLKRAIGSCSIRVGTGFRSVLWGDQLFSFTPNQADCFALLYQDFIAGTPEVGEQALLAEAVGKDVKGRLSHVFRTRVKDKRGRSCLKQHPAWGTMIVPGQTKGSFRIIPPRQARPRKSK